MTTIAPGLRDVLLTGKASEAVRRKDKQGRFIYDAVVMDAPPTGRISQFLNVNTEVAGLAKVGPIRNHADTVMRVIRSPETAVHFVTLLEEMPVQETLDGLTDLKESGLPIGGVLINMVRPPILTATDLAAAAIDELDIEEILMGVKAAGLDDGAADIARGLAAEGAEHAQRVGLEEREKARLAAVRQPQYELPMLTEGWTWPGSTGWPTALREQGAA